MREELPVPEKGKIRHRRRCVLRGLAAVDMDDLQRNAVFGRRFRKARHPIVGIGALIGIIEYKAAFLYLRMLCAFPEARRFFAVAEGQIKKLNAGVGFIRDLKPLVSQIFGIGEKALLFCGRQDTEALSPLYSDLMRTA